MICNCVARRGEEAFGSSGAAQAEMSSEAASARAAANRSTVFTRAFWVRQLLSWHWISAAIALIGMMAFAITGITLNHAGDIAAQPVVRERTVTLPANLLSSLASAPDEGRHPLPAALSDWADDEFGVQSSGREAEWSAEEIYLAMARPGGDAWISIDRATGEVIHQDTWRGWVAYFNDLHKGRNTGVAWAWFIDIFAGACVLFCLTGFGLLWLKAVARPSTWPLIGLGLIIPIVLALLFIH